jgi:capsular exopolysaccharide synthesis family protein
MESLQQAVDRFKQQQGSDMAAPRRQAGEVRQVPPPIVYSSTKTVELADHMMRDLRLITGYEGGPFVDAYKMLRTQVVQGMRQNGWKALGVTSPTSREGKTLTAVNLSLALAMDLAHTVLLVDADMRRPDVHRAFGLDGCPGLSEHLLDEVPLEQLLIHPGIGRFVFLPGGRSITNSAEALASPRMASLVEELKGRYASRLIVFDLPPLLTRADVLGFATHLDAVLLVTEEGKTASTDIQRAVAVLKGTVSILGAVLNKAGRSSLSRRRAMEMLVS